MPPLIPRRSSDMGPWSCDLRFEETLRVQSLQSQIAHLKSQISEVVGRRPLIVHQGLEIGSLLTIDRRVARFVKVNLVVEDLGNDDFHQVFGLQLDQRTGAA